MNILIADDNPTNLKLLRAMLEAAEHHVWAAADGVEALRLMKQHKPEAIISDILMPRMDGYRFCLEVRKQPAWKRIPFIFYTSTYTSPSDEKTALQMGADKFLKKPSSSEEILAALKAAAAEAPRRVARRPKPEIDLMKEYNARLVTKLEKKNAELEAQAKTLRNNQAQLRLQATALEKAANAMIVTDTTGKALWVNPAFCALTGYSCEEILGQNPRLLKSGKHGRAFYEHLWDTILAGDTWQGEFINRRKDGNLYHGEQTITPVREDDGSITHFIGIMNDVTERRRSERELRESREQLRALMARLQEAREEERIRIAREMHDGLGSMLTGIEMNVTWVRLLLEKNGAKIKPAELLEKLDEITRLVGGTADTVRKLCTELRPSVLDDMGLVAAIEWQTREFEARTRIRCESKLGVSVVAASREQATAIFRIFQEILTNVARHSGASKLRVRFELDGSDLVLEVKDNGKGIPAAIASGAKSLGLLGMKERVGLLGGKFEIAGAPGKGTRVAVIVPMGKQNVPVLPAAR